MTPARTRALQIASDGLIRAKSALASEAACSTGVIDGLIEAGCLVEVVIPERRFPRADPGHATVTFTEAQQQAVGTLIASVDAGAFSVSLLDGVTGSGKTEVYFEAVARTLERGRQALIMLPEIALTSQFMDRFRSRFGAPPAEWHSALSGPERGRVWRAAAGEARVIVGARPRCSCRSPTSLSSSTRSTIGFKQGTASLPGRRVRAYRGRRRSAASATPSIESHVNARRLPPPSRAAGRYRRRPARNHRSICAV